MLELAAPWWLAGLGTLPALRWLHRFRAADRRHLTSALFLWRGAGAEAAGEQRALPPDPVWRLRAAVVTAAVLALAGPAWTVPGAAPLVVWVDDSLSLQTREGGVTRAALAGEALAEALGHRPGAGPITLRSLSDPTRALGVTRTGESHRREVLRGWLGREGAEPATPAPATLDPASEHWLVTDGADERVAAWAAQAPLARVVQVGAESENGALTWLGVRPALDGSGDLVGTVGSQHLGLRPSAREVVIEVDGQVHAHWPVSLAPGAPTQRGFRLPAGPHRTVLARLEPADALAADDGLTLALPERPLPTRVTGGCGRHLGAAIATHPALTPAPPGGPAALTVSCGPAPAGETTGALLRVHGPGPRPAGPTPRRVLASGPLAELDLEPGWLRPAGGSPPTGANVLLELDGRPAVTAGPAQRVDVLLDLEWPDLARQPGYPALVAALLDTLAGRDLTSGVAQARRDPVASRVQPLPLPPAAPAVAASVTVPRDLSPWLLTLAAALIAVDLGRTVRRTLLPRPVTRPAPEVAA